MLLVCSREYSAFNPIIIPLVRVRKARFSNTFTLQIAHTQDMAGVMEGMQDCDSGGSAWARFLPVSPFSHQ